MSSFVYSNVPYTLSHKIDTSTGHLCPKLCNSMTAHPPLRALPQLLETVRRFKPRQVEEVIVMVYSVVVHGDSLPHGLVKYQA